VLVFSTLHQSPLVLGLQNDDTRVQGLLPSAKNIVDYNETTYLDANDENLENE
jgi:hypothetical protein